MDLKVKHASTYDGRSPQYHLPREIGCFSINSENEYCNDGHQMKYIAMPNKLTDLRMDLNEGYSDFIDRFEDKEPLFYIILKWIVAHEDQIKHQFADSNPKIDFVFNRGFFSKVSSTIYERNNEWHICASKFRSVIYMAGMPTMQELQLQMDLGEKGDRMQTWGFKFEQYMTSDTMNSRPNTSVPVNENEKYFAVMKGKLDDHRFLFGSEMDGVDPEHFKEAGNDPASALRYVELKTSKMIISEKDKRIFRRYKLLQWYLQSFFIGTLRVICGHRDDDGIVRELGIYNVRDMPKMAKGLWSPAACLNFFSQFLHYVKRCVVKDDPKVLYRIYWKPGSDIKCEEVPSKVQFLPDWYTESVKVI